MGQLLAHYTSAHTVGVSVSEPFQSGDMRWGVGEIKNLRMRYKCEIKYDSRKQAWLEKPNKRLALSLIAANPK
eukprot:6180205-Pleurochrysis_carterae.AAC.1